MLTEGHGGRHAWLDLQPLGTQTLQPHPPTHPPTYVPSVCRAVALCMAAEPAYCLAMASPCSLYIASSKGHTTSNCWLLNGKPTCLCMAHIRVGERVCGHGLWPSQHSAAPPHRHAHQLLSECHLAKAELADIGAVEAVHAVGAQHADLAGADSCTRVTAKCRAQHADASKRHGGDAVERAHDGCRAGRQGTPPHHHTTTQPRSTHDNRVRGRQHHAQPNTLSTAKRRRTQRTSSTQESRT